MKTIFKVFLSLFTIMAISFSSFAQNFSVFENQQTEAYGQVQIPEFGGTTITHSIDPVTIIPGNSVACSDSGITTFDNQYWRSFLLTDFGITLDFSVTLVEIGIEGVLSGNGTGVQPMTCNLYVTDGTPFPGGFPTSLTLIGTLSMDIPDQMLSLFPIPVSGVASSGSELVVEISIPDATGGNGGHSFFIGSNNAGQTAPSYISSMACGTTIPTDIALIGFPDMMIVMSVTGDETVPVELTSFTANVNNAGNVILNWSTATEVNNQLFEIERRNTEHQFNTIGFVEGYGTTTEPQQYSYIDNSVETGTYFYRLKQIDFGGQYEYSDEIEVEVNGPLTFTLEQNYPNPFNPSTNIKFSVPTTGQVKLSVYSLVGEEVAVLVNGLREAGFYEVTFNASNLPSGAYFYEIESSNAVQLKKMMLLK